MADVREAETALAAAKQAQRDAKMEQHLTFARHLLTYLADMKEDYFAYDTGFGKDVVPFAALEVAAERYGFVVEQKELTGDGLWRCSVTRKKSAAAAADEA
jgi:hypothetical protein